MRNEIVELKYAVVELNLDNREAFRNDCIKRIDNPIYETHIVEYYGSGGSTKCYALKDRGGEHKLIKIFSPNKEDESAYLTKDWLMNENNLSDLYDYIKQKKLVDRINDKQEKGYTMSILLTERGFGLSLDYSGGEDFAKIMDEQDDNDRSLEVGTLVYNLEILYKMADMIAHYHEYGIFHGDVKPSNFLVSKNKSSNQNEEGALIVENIDFDSCRYFNDFQSGVKSTACYYNFESLKYIYKNKYQEEALRKKALILLDVKALTVILYELFDPSLEMKLKNIDCALSDAFHSNAVFFKYLSQEIKTIIKKYCDYNVQKIECVPNDLDNQFIADIKELIDLLKLSENKKDEIEPTIQIARGIALRSEDDTTILENVKIKEFDETLKKAFHIIEKDNGSAD